MGGPYGDLGGRPDMPIAHESTTFRIGSDFRLRWIISILIGR